MSQVSNTLFFEIKVQKDQLYRNNQKIKFTIESEIGL